MPVLPGVAGGRPVLLPAEPHLHAPHPLPRELPLAHPLGGAVRRDHLLRGRLGGLRVRGQDADDAARRGGAEEGREDVDAGEAGGLQAAAEEGPR